MTELLIKILCTIGALFILIAALGIHRMPDFYTRLSVTVKAGTIGVGCILLAVSIYFFDFSVTTKVFAIIFFLFITSPVAAYMISRTAYVSGVKLWDKSIYNELEDFERAVELEQKRRKEEYERYNEAKKDQS